MRGNKYKKGSVPANMRLREASNFWDEHSFLDYDDVAEVNFDINLKEEKHYFAIEKDLAKQIRQAANQRGISAEALVNLWLKSKLTETI
jgi:hypothetical protein